MTDLWVPPRVFNLDTLIDLGTLYEHTGALARRQQTDVLMVSSLSGTITALAFHKKQHMFSGSEDGSICIWRCKDWEMLTSLKAQCAASVPLHRLRVSVQGASGGHRTPSVRPNADRHLQVIHLIAITSTLMWLQEPDGAAMGFAEGTL